ncbi:putative TIM-barrel fold metal-dependent hydrolase [Mycolicibacterium fortuitum]|uniref:Putative TIM-barrel fold metal-dependent hydrolase n=1 Tax=Mycolicibacterium fortuitum TaxID=1766 RepID=A0A378U777_MYCFO|nr:putative TIM-barrel fold metal-dependent hydrolase [Mycolicibacterium fortuitum]
MNKDDMILISVDDHIVEPPDMFKNHLPKKYADEAPRLVHNPDGSDTWQFRDIVIPNVALNAVAGRPKEEYGLEPQGLDEIRKGCYNVDERVKDMNAGGILGSICFPSFPVSQVVCSLPRTRSSRWRWCGPTTTGTSTNGAAPIRLASSRWHCR